MINRVVVAAENDILVQCSCWPLQKRRQPSLSLRIIPAKAMPTNSSGRLGFGYAQDPNDKAHPIVNMPAPLRGEQLRTNKSSREPSAYEVKSPL